jgi:class 3 adenylate cyclase
MEVDEADTLVRLKATRERLIDPKIRAHGGRIVKLMGDGALVEFSSVVDAVGCAFEIQRTVADCNAELPAAKRLEFRIGVNLGDVIVEGDDIYGDGVNVAARLEKLADPGGVLISGAAFDQVESKLDNEFDFLGEQRVKNIEKPIRVYRVRLGERGAAARARAATQRHRVGRWAAAAIAVLVLVAAGAAIRSGLYSGWTHPAEVASKANMALPLPDKPSIAVLPFTDMSSDASQ